MAEPQNALCNHIPGSLNLRKVLIVGGVCVYERVLILVTLIPTVLFLIQRKLTVISQVRM